MMAHDFKSGEKVYLMSGKKLYVGTIIGDNNYGEYISVNWINQRGGSGSPHFSSLHRDKSSAIKEWYDKALINLEKSHKRILNTKI